MYLRFVAALVGGADYAKGSRFANSGGSDDINLPRKLGNRILCGMEGKLETSLLRAFRNVALVA